MGVRGGAQGAAMSLFPDGAIAMRWTSLNEVLTWYNIDQGVWLAFVGRVGDPGESVRLMAALPGRCQSRGVLRRHAPVYDSSGPCWVGLAVLQENGFHFWWWCVGRLEGHGSVAAVAGDYGGWIQPRGFWRWWFFVYTDWFGNGNRKPQREGKDNQDVGSSSR